MPDKTAADAPKTLPQQAKEIWASAFNSAWSGTCAKSGKRRDECAARVAFGAVKKTFRQDGQGKWVPKAALVDISLVITKASIQDDGTLRWQATVSDTAPDRAGEQTSIALFQDWIDRIQTGKSVPFLSPPRLPFLGLSHYPSLDGFGEAGITQQMYVDGNRLKVNGVFYDDDEHPLGRELFEAIRAERSEIRKGNTIEKPIRISAAWWDLSHKHGDFVFERKSLDDICPMCLPDVPRPKDSPRGHDKIYLAGQPDHWAGTRLPINPRTDIQLEEKSMATKKQDAASIVSEELAEELDKRANKPTGKSETEQPEGMVIKSDEPVEGESVISEKADSDLAVDAPLGGAMTMDEAEAHLEAQEMAFQARSNWYMFQAVMDNVMALSPPEELATNMKAAITSFNAKMETLKAAVSDAFLLQQPISKGEIIMSDKKQADDGQQPFDVNATIKAAIDDQSLDREGKIEAIQKALDQFAETVQADLDAASPPTPLEKSAERIEQAVVQMTEAVQLLAAKAGTAPPQSQTQQPQQKSLVPGAIVPGQPTDNLPISPITKQPSALTQMIRRSVGIQ